MIGLLAWLATRRATPGPRLASWTGQTALTIAMIPALIASGNSGQAATTAARSGSVLQVSWIKLGPNGVCLWEDSVVCPLSALYLR
jgi:hypothetical protein